MFNLFFKYKWVVKGIDDFNNNKKSIFNDVSIEENQITLKTEYNYYKITKSIITVTNQVEVVNTLYTDTGNEPTTFFEKFNNGTNTINKESKLVVYDFHDDGYITDTGRNVEKLYNKIITKRGL